MGYLATSKNAVISFTSAITGTTTFTGFSDENILSIPDVDVIKSKMGCDGILSRSVVAKKLNASFSFHPGSPSLLKIYQWQQAAYLSGIPIVGILTVALESIGQAYVFLDCSFESGAKGLEAADELKSVTIKWSSQLPNLSSLGAIAQTALGAV